MGAQVLNVHLRGAIKPLSVSAQPSFYYKRSCLDGFDFL